MSESDRARRAWQASADDARLPELDAVRAGADLFYRRIRRRNRIEYVASAFVIICFSAYALFLPSPVARLGALLVVIGTAFMAWQLHRRGSAVAPPDAGGSLPLLAHQRSQLVRQRDACAGVFRWYLLPFLPGLALMVLAPPAGQARGAFPPLDPGQLIAAAVVALVFAGIWWLNRLAARKLQRAIDEIDALVAADA